MVFTVDDLKAALRRRGPDALESKKLHLHFNFSGQKSISSIIEDHEAVDTENLQMVQCGNKCDCGPAAAEFHFIGAILQLRGLNPVVQPLVDSNGNILLYNGTSYFLWSSV